MSSGRRTIDRRRRVLYSTHQADQTGSTAASRREFERLREARRPTAAYGARVKRRLRGRWFSLVPVKRRSFTILASVISVGTIFLCLTHYAAVAWPSLVYRPEIARPLRLDVPDSFGRWFMVALLSASTGIALMTYQLRRYRLDDYLGRYRLWRLVLIVLAIASVNALVGLIDWTGAILDLTFGKRVALTGGDWLRVVVGLGGAVVVLRMIAEMRRSRIALSAMLWLAVILMVGQAAQWNVIDYDTEGMWALVTSVPLLASAALFVAMTGNLRMLYREVREIEDSTGIRERMSQIFQRSERPERDEAVEPQPSSSDRSEIDDAKATTKRGWFRRQRRESEPEAEATIEAKPSRPQPTPKPPTAPQAEVRKTEFRQESKAETTETQTETEETSDQPKRRWFGMRAAKSPVPESQTETHTQEAKPKPPAKAEATASDVEDAPPRKPGLSGWFSRKKSADPAEQSDGPAAASNQPAPRTQTNDSDADDDENVDPDSVDWNGMSKAERRRMKKQMRRQDRAA